MNPFFVSKLLRVRLGIFLVKVIISNTNWMEAGLLFFFVSGRGWYGLCPMCSSPWIAVRSCILKLRNRSVIAPWLYFNREVRDPRKKIL